MQCDCDCDARQPQLRDDDHKTSEACRQLSCLATNNHIHAAVHQRLTCPACGCTMHSQQNSCRLFLKASHFPDDQHVTADISTHRQSRTSKPRDGETCMVVMRRNKVEKADGEMDGEMELLE